MLKLKGPFNTHCSRRLCGCRSMAEARQRLRKAHWKDELVASGDGCITADLSGYTDMDGWRVYVVESAMLEAHRHGTGTEYGERVVVLVGWMEDVDANNHLVELRVWGEIIHGPGSIHQPQVPEFCIFLVHRPAGLLPLFSGHSPLSC